jgi:hypothetical protein
MARALHLADGGARQTTPGSISHEIATTAMAASLAAHRGLTVSEHRRAFEAAHGAAPRTYGAQFGSLAQRGILVAVAGRTSATRFSHRDALVGRDEAHDDDDLVMVRRALASACARYQRAVTTREVARELETLGLTLGSTHPNAVRQRLQTMVQTRRRGRPEWRGALAVRESVPSATAFLSVRWRPVDLLVPVAATVPSNAVDALRTIIAAAEDALGGPVSASDLIAWCGAHPTHLAVAGLGAARLSELLPSAAKVDARSGRETRILSRPARRDLAGDAPMTYHLLSALRCPRPMGVAAHRLAEALDGLRPADEWASIDLLRRRATRVGVAALAHLADLREHALQQALSMAVTAARAEVGGTATDPLRMLAVVETLREQMRTRDAWVAALPPNHRVGRRLRGQHAERRRHLDVVASRIGHNPEDRPLDVTVVGPAQAVGFDALSPFVQSAITDAGWTQHESVRFRVVAGCRRFDDATPRDRYLRTKHRGDRLRVDRADALHAIMARTASPRVAALLASATELLGSVVRDAVVLGEIADACRPIPGARAGDPGTWRAAMIARALLGVEPAESDIHTARTGDRLTATAAGLAAVLALGEGSQVLLTRMMRGSHLVATAATVMAGRVRGGRIVCAVT